jgi:hypothetical protein
MSTRCRRQAGGGQEAGRRQAGGGAIGDSVIPDAKHTNGYAIGDMHTVLTKQNVSEEATRGAKYGKGRAQSDKTWIRSSAYDPQSRVASESAYRAVFKFEIV